MLSKTGSFRKPTEPQAEKNACAVVEFLIDREVSVDSKPTVVAKVNHEEIDQKKKKQERYNKECKFVLCSEL